MRTTPGNPGSSLHPHSVLTMTWCLAGAATIGWRTSREAGQSSGSTTILDQPAGYEGAKVLGGPQADTPNLQSHRVTNKVAEAIQSAPDCAMSYFTYILCLRRAGRPGRDRGVRQRGVYFEEDPTYDPTPSIGSLGRLSILRNGRPPIAGNGCRVTNRAPQSMKLWTRCASSGARRRGTSRVDPAHARRHPFRNRSHTLPTTLTMLDASRPT